MNQLSTRVVVLALTALVTALLLVGAGTSALLWIEAEAALDRALLAAAIAEAHPEPTERWRPEHLASTVSVRPWTPSDPLVGAELVEPLLVDERPLWRDLGDQRVLVIVAEPEDAPTGPDGSQTDHPHALVVASAPQVTFATALGPFLLAYALTAALTALLLGALLALALRRSLEPLRTAAARLDALGGREVGAQVVVDGPDEVQRVLAATNALLYRLERASTGQRRFVADAAHELRTPVTRILGELDLALRQPRTAEAYRTALATTHTQAARLAELVEGLLMLARLDAGQGRAAREQVPEHASAVVLGALAAERGALDAAGCTVDLQLEEDPLLSVDGALLQAAVANLLRNAAVHASESTVRVRVAVGPDAVQLVVQDSGPGLPEGATERVLERFHRGAHNRPGLGLGLPLAREIARHHGGDLRLSRSALGGLEATIDLPKRVLSPS